MSPVVYLDGQFLDKEQAKVSVFDHGFLYGDGVFEGIRAYSGRVFRLDEHVERLYRSAKAIMLEIPGTPEEMREAVLDPEYRKKKAEAEALEKKDPNFIPRYSMVMFHPEISYSDASRRSAG